MRALLAWLLVLATACGHARPATNTQATSSARATRASASGTPQTPSSSTAYLPAGVAVRTDGDLARQSAAAINRFGFDLYRRTSVKDGNLILSPLSAAVALAMTAAGARGPTYDEMARVLRLRDISDVDAAFHRLLSSLGERDGEGVSLHLAQRLWAPRGFPFGAGFLARLTQGYGAPVGVVNFADPEAARVTINQWAALETKDRIRELLEPGDVTTGTRLVLTNAVHFAGRWRSRFDEGATQKQRFATSQGTVSAPMMHQLGRFAHARLPSFAMLELPCLGDFSVIILLPDSIRELAAVELQLGEHYENGLARLVEQPIDVYLPRWKTASSLRLNSALKGMGMLLAFGSGDFSPMSPTEALSIDLVLQQASVEVNEEGAEAAAATAVIMGGYGFPPPPATFRADHPFVYLIRDRTTGVVLFTGRVSDPS